MAEEFNVLDAKWSKDAEKYPNDKAETWSKNPVSRDGWFVIHEAIRLEMNEFKDAAAAIKTLLETEDKEFPAWMAVNLKTWWDYHEELVHSHHDHEEKIFFPALSERINFPPKLTDDHVELVRLLTVTSDAVKAFSSDEGDKAAKLVKIIAVANAHKELQEHMCPHLKEEEDIGIALQRAYFTPKEVAAITAEIMQTLTAYEEGMFFRMFKTPAEMKLFLKQEGIPFFVYWKFTGSITTYMNDIKHLLDDIIAGEQTIVDRSCGCSIS